MSHCRSDIKPRFPRYKLFIHHKEDGFLQERKNLFRFDLLWCFASDTVSIIIRFYPKPDSLHRKRPFDKKMSYQNPPALGYTFNRLEGKVIFVTGASSGIGAAAAKLFAKEGAKVAVAARRLDKLNVVVEQIKAGGHEAIAVECDVTSEDSVERAISTTVEEFGRLDGAFNSAGLPPTHAAMHEVKMEDYDAGHATNLRGTVVCMKHEVRAMLKTKGTGGCSIVNTSSVGGLVAAPANSIYAASKWGLSGVTKCAAMDYVRQNIRINAVAPGPTRSEMFDALWPDEERRTLVAGKFPMNYIAEADDMARAALFLLSEESRWTTGTVLACDGGRSIT